MKTTKIKAIFRGKDGSCGYSNGREYELKAWQHSEGGHRNIAIELASSPDEKYCEYESIISFLENWDCIRHLSTTNS